MLNQQLQDYIKQQLQLGVSIAQIKQSLLASGWPESDIDLVCNQIIQSNSQKKFLKKIILIALALTALTIGSIAFINYRNPSIQDISPIDDSDLQLQKVEIADNDNAYFAIKKIRIFLQDSQLNQIQNIQDASAGMINNLQALNGLLDEASKKPSYQNPDMVDPKIKPDEVVLTDEMKLLNAAKISKPYIISLAKQGKTKEALDAATSIVRIGKTIQSAPIIGIGEYMIAVELKSVGLETLQEIISMTKLTKEQASQYREKLDYLFPTESDLVSMSKSEYQFQITVLNDLVKKNNSSVIDPRQYQPNKTKLLFVEQARRNIAYAKDSCDVLVARPNISRPEQLDTKDMSDVAAVENIIGKEAYSVLWSEFLPLYIDRYCSEKIMIGATQIMLAVRAFQNDTGRYPSSLEELVPNYFNSIPIDPFDGKSLKYSMEKKIIYSIGKDLKDSGGSTGDRWVNMDDPTFFLNFSNIFTSKAKK